MDLDPNRDTPNFFEPFDCDTARIWHIYNIYTHTSRKYYETET